ncbi:MAG: FAD-binding oxidoreductase [candidate division Zixibacteria bacterium]|nr:FAD-binding oxidoreductase [candidate division Zixibacteria bacterium]
MYYSWGRYPKVSQKSSPIFWRGDSIPIIKGVSLIPHGLGRSYGDICLNDGNYIIPTRALNHFIDFNPENGRLTCEAGVSLAEIIALAVPHGWFLPVTPGTKFVTVGGAIANDVHGKNHHIAGTFGNHVLDFELLRSNGERFNCSLESNPDLFKAAIGGMGLTGLITKASIQLIPIQNNLIQTETIKFKNLDAFFELSATYGKKYAYTVAWIDSMASGKSLGRGHFIAGKHAGEEFGNNLQAPPEKAIPVPIDFPEFVLNNLSIKAFNLLYYNKQLKKRSSGSTDFNTFFYPLDSIMDWNKVYGKRGMLQYQCLVPYEDREVIRSILKTISDSGQGSFLAVMKIMGDIPSPGMISFSGPGITLALDFPVTKKVFSLFLTLDKIVRAAGGRLYSAKDACMSADDFKAYYPAWKEFEKYIDPKFSSSFWRRVTGEVKS